MRQDISTVMASLTASMKEDECIIFALQLRSAWSLSDYHRFFRLYAKAPKMSGFLIDWFVERERKAAMKLILKSYVYLFRCCMCECVRVRPLVLRPYVCGVSLSMNAKSVRMLLFLSVHLILHACVFWVIWASVDFYCSVFACAIIWRFKCCFIVDLRLITLIGVKVTQLSKLILVLGPCKL